MKVYAIAAAIIAVVVLLPGTYFAGYRSGVTSTNSKNQSAIIKYKDRESKLLLALDKANKKREIIYHEEIKIIEGAVGKCLDTDMPDNIYRLFNNDPR